MVIISWFSVLTAAINMKQLNSIIDTIDQIVTDGVQRGILHLYTEENKVNGNIITLKNRKVVNFGSCSYLGLEFDERLTQGAINAIKAYGTQFSESRAYVSVEPYRELESLLENIFGLPVVVTATTTLGHISNIPVLVGGNDAVIMDHQVHHSVQTAVNLVKVKGVHTELLRHNRTDLLEQRIIALRRKYDKIWYMADGVYSMFGDNCPVDEIKELLDKYPEFNFYADDAHGMSIYGENGKGYILSRLPHHERMFLATSLNKAFASGGGVLVFPNRESARRVRSCGGPMITSGPLQPPNLGAAIAAAKIHLSSEIYDMQEALQANILFANLMLKKYQLPVISESDAAVFFIGVSTPGMGYNLVKRMLNRGYYVNLGIFPAVPIKNTGIRFTITRLHTFTQIENMVSALAEEFARAMEEENITLRQIYHAFRLPLPEEQNAEKTANTMIHQVLNLDMKVVQTIKEINRQEWDSLFRAKGSFDWEGLCLMEEIFSNNPAAEDNWQFDYVIIRDNNQQPVLATFLTTALWKDDMLSPSRVSEIIEQKRLLHPYYLTSKVVSAGSLISEGEHIYINRESPFWKEAVLMLSELAGQLQEKYEANTIMLRDFPQNDPELFNLLSDNGFFRIQMPEANIIPEIKWHTEQEFVSSLSKKSKQHYKADIARYTNKFEICKNICPSEKEILAWHQLYCNVKNRGLELNTFTLPRKFFEKIAAHPNWDILTLHRKDSPEETLAVMCSYQSGNSYSPMILGMNYNYLNSHKLYKQCLFRAVMRGRELGAEKIFFGFSASTEKKKVGAVQVPVYAFVQVKDDFNLKEIENISVSQVSRE